MTAQTFRVSESEFTELVKMGKELIRYERFCSRTSLFLIVALILCIVVAVFFRFYADSYLPIDVFKNADVPQLDWLPPAVGKMGGAGLGELYGSLAPIFSITDGPLFKSLSLVLVLIAFASAVAKQSFAPVVVGLVIAGATNLMPVMIKSVAPRDLNGASVMEDKKSIQEKIVNTIVAANDQRFESIFDINMKDGPQLKKYFIAQQYLLSDKTSDPVFIEMVSSLEANVSTMGINPDVYALMERKAFGEVKSEYSSAILKSNEQNHFSLLKKSRFFAWVAAPLLTLLIFSTGCFVYIRRNRLSANKSLDRSLEIKRSYEASQIDPA